MALAYLCSKYFTSVLQLVEKSGITTDYDAALFENMVGVMSDAQKAGLVRSDTCMYITAAQRAARYL